MNIEKHINGNEEYQKSLDKLVKALTVSAEVDKERAKVVTIMWWTFVMILRD